LPTNLGLLSIKVSFWQTLCNMCVLMYTSL